MEQQEEEEKENRMQQKKRKQKKSRKLWQQRQASIDHLFFDDINATSFTSPCGYFFYKELYWAFF